MGQSWSAAGLWKAPRLASACVHVRMLPGLPARSFQIATCSGYQDPHHRRVWVFENLRSSGIAAMQCRWPQRAERSSGVLRFARSHRAAAACRADKAAPPTFLMERLYVSSVRQFINATAPSDAVRLTVDMRNMFPQGQNVRALLLATHTMPHPRALAPYRWHAYGGTAVAVVLACMSAALWPPGAPGFGAGG